MKRIMFVCHGNICRSPMAEFIFKDIIKRNLVQDEYYVSSSATSTEEIYRGIGNPVYPPAAAVLSLHGIECKGKRAVVLEPSDAGNFDMFIGMDSANIRNMHRILGTDAEDKIFKLLDFTGSGRDVTDPWYSERFDIAYSDIYEGCCALYSYLARGSYQL